MSRDDVARDAEAAFHYETSNEFFKLFLDPTMTYSCAYFATGSESLEEAHMAKVDLAFQRVNLQRGDRLLDIVCGWGAAAERAAVKHGASAVGLTVSQQQFDLAHHPERPGLAVSHRL